MKKSWIAAIVVIVGLAIAVPVLISLLPENRIKASTDYQHEVDGNVNPQLGSATISEDFVLDEEFVTHLPLVIIDLQGNEIPNIYKWTSDGNGREYNDVGLANPDPWVSMSISIIDNDSNENRLTDVAQFTNNGKIKLRGMTSRNYAKKQYGIKFMDGEEELETSVLGMEADEDWVLSNSLIDLSGVRNYVAMNIGRQIMPFTSEVRFCEVVFKDGDTYTYQGLYLLSESIKKATGRVEVEDYRDNSATTSYIVCRDRYNKTKVTLSTWASDQQLCYGWFTMVYPNDDMLSENAINAIESELSKIEKILYSDDPQEFLKYREYLDVDSFVDYYLFHEFFMNYDAGNNSTYYYKTKNGKLAIGPIWDFDNAMDNYDKNVANLHNANFAGQPWFDRLLMDKDFQEKLIARYEELRKGILNEDYIEKFIDESYAYLGNARARDFQRWEKDYKATYNLVSDYDANGNHIERDINTPKDDLVRLKDVISIHGRWMEEELENAIYYKASMDITEEGKFDASGIAVIGVLIFGAIIILLLRFVKGEYR